MIVVMELCELPRVKRGMPQVCETLDAGALFETYHDRIYRYVLRLVKNPAEAEDLTQDTFLRAYRGRDSLREPEAVRGWLYRIATDVSLDRLRQHVSTVSIDGEEGTALTKAIASRSPSVLEMTERKETSLCVQRCLDVLPDSYRAVILLHEVYSLTAAQMAELLGVTVTTVKIRLHRARRRLQKVMERGCAISNDNRGRPVCQPKQ